MADKLSNWAPLSASDIEAGLTGTGLLKLPFKRIGLGKELAQQLLNDAVLHAKYAYKMRARLIKPLTAEIRQLKRVHSEACVELEKLDLTVQGSIADYYVQQLEERISKAKLVWWQSLHPIRLLRKECKKILASGPHHYESDTAMAFSLGQFCSEIENARFFYFYQEQQIRTKIKYGAKNSAKGQWRGELGWRLYFDYWIHGKTIERRDIVKKYSDLLPANYLTAMSDKTLRVAITEQLHFYSSIDNRVPKPDTVGRRSRKESRL